MDILGGMWPFLLLMAAMWFLMIAPQRKKQKEHAKLLASIKPGDEILCRTDVAGRHFGMRICEEIKEG